MIQIEAFELSIERLKSVIRAYDVRGIVPDMLNDQDAFVFGCVLGYYLQDLSYNFRVVLGIDNRVSSVGLSNALISGFNLAGVLVENLGIVPTPQLYYSAFTSHLEENTLGVMITASHNPPPHNGFKIIFNCKILDGSAILAILERYQKQLIAMSGMIASFNSDYIKYLLNRSGVLQHTNTSINALWDCNNGATSNVIQQIVVQLKNDNTIINTEDYILEEPNPTTDRNIQRVKDLMHNFDIAFCFDGDGDRLTVITNDGCVLRGDKILLILASFFSDTLQNRTIVVDIKTSYLIINELQNLGYDVIIEKTGHSFIKGMMRQTKALLGGEISGHLFFNFPTFDSGFIPYDDAILAACYMLKIALQDKHFISDVINKLPQTFCKYDVKIECNKEQQINVIQHLKRDLINTNKPFIDIDGIKYHDDNYWWLVRQSNTESALILCIESCNQDEYYNNLRYISNILKLHGIQHMDFTLDKGSF